MASAVAVMQNGVAVMQEAVVNLMMVAHLDYTKPIFLAGDASILGERVVASRIGGSMMTGSTSLW